MGVIIGMDPHKRSATIEVDRRREPGCCDVGRFGTDKTGYVEMLGAGRASTRIGCGRSRAATASGKHIAHRLVHDGETVVDVPAKLSAQVRVFATGNGRKMSCSRRRAIPTPRSVRCVAGPTRRSTGAWPRDGRGCGRPSERWIRDAREAGGLGPAKPGVASA